MSLAETEAGIVTVLASTSSLFTLFLAGFYPSNNSDKFTLSKLVAVTISIFGLVSSSKDFVSAVHEAYISCHNFIVQF